MSLLVKWVFALTVEIAIDYCVVVVEIHVHLIFLTTDGVIEHISVIQQKVLLSLVHT